MASNQILATEVENVKTSARAPEASNSAATNVTATPSSPPTAFQIIRVRKPDGTIVRVKRPIPATPIQSHTALAKLSLEPSAPNTIDQSHASNAGASTDGGATTASPKPPQVNQKTNTTSHNSTSQISNTQPAGKLPVKQAADAKSSQIATKATSGFRLYNGFHKFRHGVRMTVAALEPDWDVGDIEEDIRNGDEYLDDDIDGNDDDDHNNNDDQKNTNRHQTQDQSSDSSVQQQQTGNTTNTGSAKNINSGSRSPIQTGALSSATRLRNTATENTPSTTKAIEPNAQKTAQNFITPKAEQGKSNRTVQVNEKDLGSNSDSGMAKSQTDSGRRLQQISLFSRFAVWSIMISIPVLFIVLGIMTATLNGSDVNGFRALAVRQAIKVGVTAWPIVFAAIVAQSLKTLATYRVERGIRLMTLEQLISSHSVASAIKQPFLLRRLDVISIGLFCLWALSPIASQALQRMSTDTEGYMTSENNVTYVDTTSPINPTFGNGAHSIQFTHSDIDALYAASFLPAGMYAFPDSDTWGNPLIPVPDFQNWKQGSDGLYDLRTSTSNLTYTSHYGIPIQKFDTEGGYAFNINSSYFEFDCNSFRQLQKKDFDSTDSPFSTSPGGTLLIKLQGGIDPVNRTDGTTVNHTVSNLAFASKIISDDGSTDSELFAYAVCNFHQVYVTSRMSCTGNGGCRVTGMQALDLPDANPHLEQFESKFVAAGVYSNTTRTLTERYINDPQPTTSNDKLTMNLTTISAKDFSQRLQSLVNTYWQIGYAPQFQTGNFTRDTVQNMNGWIPLQNSTATITANNVFVCSTNWAWLSILFLCSVVLLVAGVAGAIWESRTVGPDVLGFASSLVRQSKYIALPKGDGTMSGAERARMLADVRVMMQDVRTGADVGRIALGTIGEGSERLRRGRLYR